MNDFIEYWAAARLLLEGRNPYSPELMLAIAKFNRVDRSKTFDDVESTLGSSVVLPFGFLSFEVGKSLWLLGQPFDRLFMHRSELENLWRAEAIFLARLGCGVGILPKPVCPEGGTNYSVHSAGSDGFPLFVRQRGYGLASCSTILISLKPHLLYLFWIALLFWIINRKQWKMLMMIGATVILATAVPLSFNPSIVAQFFRSSLEAPPLYWVTPTIGGFLGCHWHRACLASSSCPCHFVCYFPRRVLGTL